MLRSQNQNHMRYQLIIISMLFPMLLTGQDITPGRVGAKGVHLAGGLQALGCIGGIGKILTEEKRASSTIQYQEKQHQTTKQSHPMPAKTPPGELP